MKRVLLTGATGFVGRHAVQALSSAGYETWAVGRADPQIEGVRFLSADLLNWESRQHAVARVAASHLLHLAWIAEPGIYWRSPVNLDWTVASLDLARAFYNAGGQRVVMTGTCAEYRWGEKRLKEGVTDCRPATFYGNAKDATRRMLSGYADERGVSAAWARLFFMYGPGERAGRLVRDAITALRTATPFPTTEGLHTRDFMHVGDVASALVALLGSDVRGPVNIGSGQAVAVREILETLAECIGNKDSLLFGQRTLSAGDPQTIEADITRLSLEIGFCPRFDLRSGLVDTVARTV